MIARAKHCPNKQQMYPLSFVTWLGCKQDGHGRKNCLNFLFLTPSSPPRYISVQLSGGQLCLLSLQGASSDMH